MIERLKWTARKFDFSQPIGLLPMTLERLRGTPVRLMHIAGMLTPAQLTRQINGEWSIQEHIGHLLDLEALHEGRIDDFLDGKEILRPADMTNAQTYAASHNDADIKMLLKNFRDARAVFVQRLEALDENVLHRTALHPRLQVPMRPGDMALFTAEHDDQHLAIIHALKEKLMI